METISKDPAKYRPIACLPTIYKLISGVLSYKMYALLENNELLNKEQKRCRKDSRGGKESNNRHRDNRE